MGCVNLYLCSLAIASVLILKPVSAYETDGGSHRYGETSLKVGFYDHTCPMAEELIRHAVADGIVRTPGIEGGVLRIHFHDCFVHGCDASVLIDPTSTNNPEKNAPANVHLRGYEVMDDAKTAVEGACPGIVSCADIVAYAARDAVFLSGGMFYEVEAGRRDGFISNANDASAALPNFSWNVSLLTANFAKVNLTQEQMITLSGGHTIGSGHCSVINSRLYSFNSTENQDPNINPAYATYLKTLCPQQNASTTLLLNLDITTPRKFDNVYFQNLVHGKGFLFSDEVLYTYSTTRSKVKTYAADNQKFQVKFAKAMIKMGRASPLKGINGEIRLNCRKFNSEPVIKSITDEAAAQSDAFQGLSSE